MCITDHTPIGLCHRVTAHCLEETIGRRKSQQAEARELTALNGRLVNDAEAAVEGRIVSLSNEVRTLNDELERRRAAEDALEAQLEISVPVPGTEWRFGTDSGDLDRNLPRYVPLRHFSGIF